MQEIILKVFAGIGIASILLLGLYIVYKAINFFDDIKTELALKLLKSDVCNLQEWKDGDIKTQEEIFEKLEKYKEVINSQIDINEKQDKAISDLSDRNKTLEDKINTEMKLSNIYGKQIYDLAKGVKDHETRIEAMESMLEEMKDRIDKLSAVKP